MRCRRYHIVETITAKISIAATNIIRFGPAGLMGTVGLLITVKAGVCSCTLALAFSNCRLWSDTWRVSYPCHSPIGRAEKWQPAG